MGKPKHHRYYLFSCVSLILSYGCSLEEDKSQKIRGHTVKFEGVAHGLQAEAGPRYCRLCHGNDLQGGGGGEPACFQCHGENWLDIDGNISRAPADHTVLQNGISHRGGLFNPTTDCSNCHGSTLAGDEEQGTPSCFLCHDQKWQ